MTTVDPTSATPETSPEPALGARIAGGCVIGTLGIGTAAWIVRTAPETAYVVVGAMLTVGWQRAHAWHDRRRQAADDSPQAPEEPADPPAPDIAAALRNLAQEGGSGVLLTRLRDYLGAPDTKTIKALLDAAGIPTRAGVRTVHGSGPGVHRDDIPPAPPTSDSTHADGCCCRSGANTNANNTPQADPREGIRVERIGASGHIIRDPADTTRHHTTTA
ncbi:hypothetical protein [Streptomyces sp. CC228A]|uniref:hypothetical protein n=1 Tax=Streptomyces sp. CC228A TaxID=2898186 RepID=UPI001F4904FA|nr:hypothetical protein [Streptomyces sp. CC228A]